MTRATPNIRIRSLNDRPPRPGGDYVVYWMTSARRVRYNFALDYAIALARGSGIGLIVLEALRIDYPWSCVRFHTFVVEGMNDNESAFGNTPIAYYPYVEPRPGAGRGLLAALSARAAAIVTDDYPCFFLPHMTAAAASSLDVPLCAVDGNGLYPMYATDRVFTTAASFRRHLQKTLPEYLGDAPSEDPVRRLRIPRVPIPDSVAARWKPGIPTTEELSCFRGIDTTIPPGVLGGGMRAARRALETFLEVRLARYAGERNKPAVEAQSDLSAYLHFGHISPHEIFARLMEGEGWSPARLGGEPTGSRSGWWGAGPNAEAFLDELVTWRELGLNMCAHRDDYDQFESLPDWALTTLRDHEADRREYRYPAGQFESARTHDPLWNAAQRQLVREGKIHNYLRMLWGKKILEWTASPRQALDIMIELNNRYALDGRDPNSYSGIFWVLGRYDRAWGPERPVFGKVRYMSSENTARKVDVGKYLAQFGQ